jgi:hypothetical protein
LNPILEFRECEYVGSLKGEIDRERLGAKTCPGSKDSQKKRKKRKGKFRRRYQFITSSRQIALQKGFESEVLDDGDLRDQAPFEYRLQIQGRPVVVDRVPDLRKRRGNQMQDRHAFL